MNVQKTSAKLVHIYESDEQKSNVAEEIPKPLPIFSILSTEKPMAILKDKKQIYIYIYIYTEKKIVQLKIAPSILCPKKFG